jgi:8-oxo-dGTP pyrophosphatase MutT (NUDIX family)
MEKPVWRVRASSYAIESPYLRIRKDEVELPDGTIVKDYYVRESHGFVLIVPITDDQRVVLVRQYRYGADAIVLELPAGSLEEGEEPADCARRELLEETGYEAGAFELIATYGAEPVRSDARAFVFLARGAKKTQPQQLDVTERIDVEVVDLVTFRALLRDASIDVGSSIAAGYLALERLGLM